MNRYFEIFFLTTLGLAAGYIILGVFVGHSLPEMIAAAFGYWWIILPMAAINAFLQASDDLVDWVKRSINNGGQQYNDTGRSMTKDEWRKKSRQERKQRHIEEK